LAVGVLFQGADPGVTNALPVDHGLLTLVPQLDTRGERPRRSWAPSNSCKGPGAEDERH
jgi:hypothetical protein